MCGGQLEEGTTVDETQVQPQSRNAPAPKKHKARRPSLLRLQRSSQVP